MHLLVKINALVVHIQCCIHNFCNWFLPPAGIRTGEQIEKLLLSRVLKKEKECSENGSFLDTYFLVRFFSKRAEISVHKPVAKSMFN